MKKVFLSLMLIASLAFAFTSCKKTTSESETHTQTFILGETSYDINNVITIENIQYNGSQDYNAIVLSQGQMTGDNSGEGKGIVIVFQGAFTSGTKTLAYDPANPTAHFPLYCYAELEVADIVNFNINDLLAQDNVYVANSGSFTLEMDDNTFTITTDGIMVEKANDAAITETSSVDYEGDVSRFVLATVDEGTLNEKNIVTAGTTTYNFPLIGNQNIAGFITETGDMMGFFYEGNTVPAGEYSNQTIIYIEEMDINKLAMAQTGTINVAIDNDIYTVDITGATINGVEYTMHYVGNLPHFDFPF